MTAREPSDAEIDAAFNDIVARFDEPGPGVEDDHRPGDDGAANPVLRGEVLDPPAGAQRDRVDEADHSDEPDDIDEHGNPLEWRVHRPPDDDELDDLDLDELPHAPLPPWRPSSVALSALLLVAGSGVVTVLLIFQVRLPWWAGWAALFGFLTGMGLLFTRLPRHRDEDSDDGAVV